MAIYALVMIAVITMILMMIIQHQGISPLESRSQYCYTNPNNYFWAGLYLYDLRHMNSYLSICLPFLVNFCQCCSVLSACFFVFFFVYYCLIFGEVKMKLIRKFQKSTISENSGFSKIDRTKNLFIFFI